MYIDELSKRANIKLWMLRRLKKLGASKEILVDLYNKQIRSVLEYASPVWNPGLSKADVQDLERIQKAAFSIIFSNQNYQDTLKIHKQKSLEERRLHLSKKFADKAAKHAVFSSWFREKSVTISTRNKSKYVEVPFRTMKMKNSPIPAMTSILNSKTNK